MVARISNDYRPQHPAVGKDIPGPAAPCHVGTARLLETGNNRTRSVGRAVRRPYSDSEESDNDVWYAEEHDTTVAQERSAVTDLETLLLNWLSVGTVTEEDAASPDLSSDSAEGCFSCGGLTHTMDQCQTLDESFPFLPTGWQAEHIGDQVILGSGPPARPRGQQTGNAD